MCSTVPSAYLQTIESTLASLNRKDILLIDSPVSGGTVRAADGTLTVLSSGTGAALQRGKQVLSLLSDKLYVIPGGIGAASNVKMINQLLAGVHIAAAAEAMGLAARMGLNTRQVYEVIINAAGNSVRCLLSFPMSRLFTKSIRSGCLRTEFHTCLTTTGHQGQPWTFS